MPEEVGEPPAQREAEALGIDEVDEMMNLVNGASSGGPSLQSDPASAKDKPESDARQ
jgi:hypothetical protein